VEALTNIGEPLNTHGLSEKDQNNLAYSRREVPNTPFEAIGLEHGWFLTWGTWKLTETHESYEALMEYMETHKWELISTYVLTLLEATKKYEAQQFLQKEKMG